MNDDEIGTAQYNGPFYNNSKNINSKSNPYGSEANHSKINKKWLLKSGACVEDIIYKEFIDFSYEHPLHPYIVNTNDETWKIAFEPDELEEIMEAGSNNRFNNPLPNEMLDILSKLDKKKTFDEMYGAFKNVEADRYDQLTLFWLKESVHNYIDLFHDENQITINTEQDFLEEVYGFIRRSRTLCCVYITALEMTFKKGSIASMSSSERLKMPESIKQIPVLLPSVLALVYNCTQAIKSTVDHIDDVSTSFSLNRNPAATLAFFPPCFVPETKSNKKRKNYGL